MSRQLWRARSAGEWRDLYLKLYPGTLSSLPSLRTCINDFSLVSQHQSLLDVNLAVMIILSGLWAKTWQYRETTRSIKHLNDTGLRNSTVITHLMYQETSQTLRHFKMAATEWTLRMEPIAQILYEQQLMHLYVSLEDLQLVAGKEGEEEARRVLPLLGAWANSQESRLALRHAGQVIRATKEYWPSGLESSSAIALYHASLVIWAYAVVSEPGGSARERPQQLANHSSETDPNNTHLVQLDGDDSVEIERFLVLGIGRPAIGSGDKSISGVVSGGDQLIPITNAKEVMLVTTLLLRQQSEFENRRSSPLVENLCKLMRSLGNAAQGIRRQSKV